MKSSTFQKNNNEDEEQEQEKFQCPKCLKLFKTKRILKIHILRIHEKRKDYICETCKKTFATSQQLKRHILLIHEKRKDHVCITCNKAFTIKEYLRRHIEGVHLKKFVCPTCGKFFLHPYNVLVHIRRAHRENKSEKEPKKFPCSMCPKLFKTKKYLKKPISNVHEGPKEIQVEESTETIDDNFVHSKPVIPEKVTVKSCEMKIPRVFVCDTCDKYGFSQSKLKSHVCKVTKTATSDNDLESHTVMPPDDSPNSFSDERIVHEGLKERNMEESTETIDDSKENKPLNNVSIDISQTQENDSEENDNLHLQISSDNNEEIEELNEEDKNYLDHHLDVLHDVRTEEILNNGDFKQSKFGPKVHEGATPIHEGLKNMSIPRAKTFSPPTENQSKEDLKCLYCDKNLEKDIWLLKPYHVILCQKCTRTLSPVVIIDNNNKEVFCELIKNDQKSEITRNNPVISQEENICDDNPSVCEIDNFVPSKIYECENCEYKTTKISNLIEHHFKNPTFSSTRLCQICSQNISPVAYLENEQEMVDELVKNDQNNSEITRNNSEIICREEKKSESPQDLCPEVVFSEDEEEINNELVDNAIAYLEKEDEMVDGLVKNDQNDLEMTRNNYEIIVSQEEEKSDDSHLESPQAFVFFENEEEMDNELVKNDQKLENTKNSVIIFQEEKKCDDNGSESENIENHEPPKIYKCESCEYTTTEVSDLIEHHSKNPKDVVTADFDLDDIEEEHGGLKSEKSAILGRLKINIFLEVLF